jgi:4-hydroxybenzoate polyprenyltransferase
VYDYETDIKNPRKASIEGAILPKKLHRLMLWLSIASALIFLPAFMKNYVLLGGYLLAIVLAVTYSIPPLRTKTKPGLDSLTSSLHFVLPALIGFLWGGGEGIIRIEFLSFFFWGIASHMLGALPDITPDKKAGMKTIATVLGETKTAFAIFFFYALSAVLLLLQGKDYFLIGSVIGGYTVFPIWSLLDRTIIPGLFRKFMYFNLFTGFIITITVILHFIR